ncbi:MAG: hypothetical protein ACC707_13020 [Thiohalomonadales bacterium]
MPYAVAAAGVMVAGNYYTSKKASEASAAAADKDLEWQNRSLDYQIKADKLPRQYRESAQSKLAGVYGLEGGTGSQQDVIDEAMQSPLYSNLLDRGEESVLRNASATGGFRSGNAQDNLTRSSQDALINTYDRQIDGLNNMANIGSNTESISNSMSSIGDSVAQAGVAQGQIYQQQQQNNTDILSNAASSYMMYQYSDIRAKDNIKYIGREKGHDIFEWTWNKIGEHLGLKGKGRGVMAHLVNAYKPKSIKVDGSFLMVNYKMLKLEKYIQLMEVK